MGMVPSLSLTPTIQFQLPFLSMPALLLQLRRPLLGFLPTLQTMVMVPSLSLTPLAIQFQLPLMWVTPLLPLQLRRPLLGFLPYVANYDDGTVSVIDTSSNTVSAAINVGTSPYAIAIAETSSGIFAYVVNYSDGTVSVINTKDNTVPATIPVGNSAAVLLRLVHRYQFLLPLHFQ